jgi:PAS domain S-box-containing protein
MADTGTVPTSSAFEATPERTARVHELRTAAILEAALDCIITADHEGRITEFNPAAERTFGYRRDEVLGRELADVIVPPWLREAHREGFARHLTTGEARVLGRRLELTAMRADGSEFPVELTITRSTLDGVPFFTGYLRDITERKRAEDQLRRSAAYLSQGQRLTQTGLWVWNPFTDHGFASEEAYRMFGFTPDEETLYTLADFPRRVHPEDRPAFIDGLQRARRDLTDFEMSYRVVHPDGEVRHMHALARPMLTDTGELREFIGTVVDVTERRRAEEAQARRAREAALRTEVSGMLARSVTLRGMLQGCTESLVRHLGVAFARIWTLGRGATVLELQASAGLYTNLDGSHSRVEVGKWKIGLIALERTPHLTNDVLGDPRIHDKEWAQREGMVAFAGYPLVVDERVVGVMAMFSRHTLDADALDTLGSIASSVAQGIERKHSEEQLRRSEAYLAEGQRLSRTGSWAWKMDTGERFWSAETFRIFGFAITDVPPPFQEVLQRVHPDDRADADRALKESLETGTAFRVQARILIGDEPVKWVETVGHPVRDEDGRVVEFIGTDIDITERMRANHNLRRAIAARYEAVLGERTRIARDMHDGLLQDVTGIALQLRATLPHVRTSPGEAATRLEQILELTERTSREARQAVVGLRAKVQSGDLVRAVESAAQRVAAQGPLTLTVTVAGRARRMPADVRDAVVSIVHEALTNVVKHAGAHGVGLTIAFGRKKLRVSVIDDGQGLPAPQPDCGTGGHFGLEGMRERATGVGASFSVRSLPGHGTVVRLEVPYGRERSVREHTQTR